MADTKTIDMTQTKNFNLDLPPYGTPDWHIFVNLNFKKIDEYIKSNLDHSKEPIVSEEGSHGMRYWKSQLEYKIIDNGGNELWIPILINGSGSGGGDDGGEGNTGESTSIVVSSKMPNQYFGEFWYEVMPETIEEGGIRVNDDQVNYGNIVVIAEEEPTIKNNRVWIDLEP